MTVVLQQTSCMCVQRFLLVQRAPEHILNPKDKMQFDVTNIS